MTDQQIELARIQVLANQLYSGWQDETDPEQMLACILRRMDPSYFYRAKSDRKTAGELLTPDLAPIAVGLHDFVAESDLTPFIKQRVCGAAAAFLKSVGVEIETKVFWDFFEGLDD
jgi:hypothetical protein